MGWWFGLRSICPYPQKDPSRECQVCSGVWLRLPKLPQHVRHIPSESRRPFSAWFCPAMHCKAVYDAANLLPIRSHSPLSHQWSHALGRSAAWATLSCCSFPAHSADLLLRGTALGQVKMSNQDHSPPPQDPPSKQGHQGGTKACRPPRHGFILQ